MKQFIFSIFVFAAIFAFSSCEKLATDTAKTSDDLIGSYRLDKIEDTFFSLEGEFISAVISCEYVDDGYHSYYNWQFGQNGAFNIYYTEWADTGERGKYKATELEQKGCYMLDKNGLTIFDGYDTERYNIEKFIRPGNVDSELIISFEDQTDPGTCSWHCIRAKHKRTIYLRAESSYNYDYF